MDFSQILSDFQTFKEKALNNRFFKPQDIVKLIAQLPAEFKVKELSKSVEGKMIQHIVWGKGSTKVMLWSQMHGDEATGTMALFDLVNFLQSTYPLVNILNENCQLLILPMVNPDGAAIFTRRNAQQIDINRDYLQLKSPEARVLKSCRDKFKPEFGFNLHDQNTLWSVSGQNQPATLSYLAPAFDSKLSINSVRENAMLVIAEMFKTVSPYLPYQIGLFDDEYEPRAFGDNFQKADTSTILIEAGGMKDDDEKQKIREYYFLSVLTGLTSIANKNYQNQAIDNYLKIPKNSKQIFHILIKNLIVNELELSVGINYNEKVHDDFCNTEKIYSIEDIGDLSTFNAYEIFDATDCICDGKIQFNEIANFELKKNSEIILAFKNGKLLQKH